MISEVLDLRCPEGPRKLLAKLRVDGKPPVITSNNLLELACQDCRRKFRAEGETDISLILHRFDILGNLVETAIVRQVKTEIVRSEISGAEYPSEG